MNRIFGDFIVIYLYSPNLSLSLNRNIVKQFFYLVGYFCFTVPKS
jgi:hypothetical protein